MRKSGKIGLGAALLASLVCLYSLNSCSSAGAGGGDFDEDSGTALSILRALGVSAVDDPPDLITTNTQGEEVAVDPDEWQPLKKTYAVFEPKAEFALFGAASESHSAYYNSIFALSANYDVDYSEDNLITDDQAWEKASNKVAAAADLDGDGLDEFVILYVISGSYYLRVYDYGAGKYSSALKVSAIIPSSEITTTSAYNYATGNSGIAPVFQYIHLCAADVDGDGTDELLFADYDTAYVLEVDNKASALGLLESKTYAAAISSLAAGDTDGDGEDELVVCVYGKGFGYYDSSLTDPISNPEFITVSSTGILEACVGDFDGDSVDELAITNDMNTSHSIYVYDTGVDSGALSLEQTIAGAYQLSTVLFCDPRAVDLDGDGVKDLYCRGYVIMNPLSGGSETCSLSSFLDGLCDPVEVGDMDGDGKEDLVFILIHDGTYCSARSVGLNTSGNLATKYDYFSAGSFVRDTTNSYTSANSLYGPRRALAVGNVDKDSARVKYTGHKLMFTDPAVVAVLVSPPYWSAVAEADEAYAGNYTNWETSYGTFTSNSSSNGFTLGASVGCTVKYEQEGGIFGIKMGQFESELTTKGYINEELSWSSTISKAVSYTAVGGEDKVIFTCVPKDVYSYEVLESPDSSDVGSTLTLEIPREYKMYSVTRSFFNEHNGVVNDIDSTVLTHTYGNPDSYPGVSEKNALLSTYGGYQSDDSLPVAQGNDSAASGVQALEITVQSGFEITTEVGVEVEASAGGGGGGLSVLADVGFSAGYIGTISAEWGTTFGGTVGYLPTKYYNNSIYNYYSGLFVYPYSDSRDGRQYWVVDYWVE